METSDHAISVLLTDWRHGDQHALERLFPLIRRELEQMARRHLGPQQGNAKFIQPSSLVQEVFLRLRPQRVGNWRNRAHFFAVASRVMRHVLVDYARERKRQKRGSGCIHVALDADAVLSPDQVNEVAALDFALQRLAAADPRKSAVLEMRFFGGLSVEKTAEALNV